jgi:hypothetical protein
MLQFLLNDYLAGYGLPALRTSVICRRQRWEIRDRYSVGTGHTIHSFGSHPVAFKFIKHDGYVILENRMAYVIPSYQDEMRYWGFPVIGLVDFTDIGSYLKN